MIRARAGGKTIGEIKFPLSSAAKQRSEESFALFRIRDDVETSREMMGITPTSANGGSCGFVSSRDLTSTARAGVRGRAPSVQHLVPIAFAVASVYGRAALVQHATAQVRAKEPHSKSLSSSRERELAVMG